MITEEQLSEYGIYTGCKVEHIGDDRCVGIVKHIDENLKNITTCNVVWIKIDRRQYTDTDNTKHWDIIWTNKLRLI
jgi:hypothetical protein